MDFHLAFLREIDGENSVRLYQDDKDVLERLQARVRENLCKSEAFFKHSWSKDQVFEAVADAWEALITEFKKRQRTVDVQYGSNE